MRALSFALVCVCVFSHVSSLDDFLDCPGNDNIWGLLRICCRSNELPKDCECFDISSSSAFTNSMWQKPQCPKDINVRFMLYNPATSSAGVQIKSGSTSSSPFDSSLPTRFVAHGFTDIGDAPWMLQMKNEYLELEPCNVVLVDWREAAKAPNYPQAVANTRIVGAMIARLVQDMVAVGASYKSFHMIGHSLGAQIMGYAGQEIQRLDNNKLRRISGLDPAGPLFESYGPVVRVDKSDADFVDIMHTDAETLLDAGFGTRYSIGHVDFYPNGGQHQPGCPPETYGILSMIDFEGEKEGGACSHGRAVDLFSNSIRKCRYNPSSGGTACTMGHHTSLACRGDHYPTTTGEEPFC